MEKAYSHISPGHLRRTLFFYLAAILFIFSLFLILTIATPIYERLKTSENNNVYHDVELTAMAVNEWGRRAMDIAIQITSRTRIRQELEKYNNKNISLTQLKAFTEPKLSDAMNMSHEITGITRLDSTGNIVAQCGQSLPLPIRSKDYTQKFDTFVSTPVIQDDRHIVVVSAPIINRSKKQIGADLVLIDLYQLKKIINSKTAAAKNYETILGYSSNGSFFKTFTGTTTIEFHNINALLEKALKGQAGMDDKSPVCVAAYHGLDIKNFGLVILKNKTELYRTLNTRLIYLGFTGIIAYIISLAGFWFLMKPLANSLLLHSDELQEKVNKQTRHLEEEIKERKKTAAQLEKIITRYRETEIALSESEARLSHIIMGSPVPTFVIDNDHCITHWNTALERISGILGSQVAGTRNQWMAFYSNKRPVMADLIFDKEPEAKISHHYSGLYRKSESVEDAYEAEDFFPDMGEHGRWLFFTAAPLRNSAGDTIGAVETLQDTSARQEVQKALRISEQKYRLLANNVTDVIWSMDMALRHNYISPSVEKMTGYTVKEAMATPLEKVFTPESYQKITQTIAKKKASDTAHEGKENSSIVMELELCHKCGKIIPVEINASFLKDESGGITGVVGITRDVFDRKQAERALRESESKFRSIFDNKGTATCLFGEDCIIRECNPTFEELCGYSKSDIINKMKWSDFVAKDDIERMVKYHDQRSKGIGSPPTQYESSLINKNGEIKTVIANISLVGKERIVSMTDITERKQTEIENEKLHAELIQAQKMEAMGSLAGGIAHDFNNILSAIIGFTELAKMAGVDNKKKEKHLDRVLTAAERAKNLVHQILTFSRQTEQEVKPLKIEPIVQEVLQLLRASLPSTIEIQSDIRSDSLVMGDPTQIHQVILNLCTNAGHAMQKNGGILQVNLVNQRSGEDFTANTPDLSGGDYIKVEVKDTGHGIPPDLMERLFEPFFTTKAQGEGTGMGLAVVHGIVKRMKGDVFVESSVGKGSAFSVYLPVVQDTQDEDTPEQDVFYKGSGHILFVDDEPAIVDIGELLLEELGYCVTSRTSGIEALEAFKSNPDKFDLVLTDMTMPQITGEKLARKITSIRKDIPIIISTGFSSAMTEEKALKLGVKGILMKPFVLSELAKVIHHALDKQEGSP